MENNTLTQKILDNVTHFKNMNEFIRGYDNPMDDETLEERLDYYKEMGIIEDITLDRDEMDDDHIIEAINEALAIEFPNLEDFIFTIYDGDESDWQTWGRKKFVYEYSEAYDFSVVGNQIFKSL